MPWNVNLTGTGEPERLRGVQVSAQFFSTLGVTAAKGRVLLPEEDQAGRNHEIVLSDGLWKRLFGGEESAINRRVSLNGESYQIVGVMPPAFFDPWSRDAELWTPIALDPALFVPNNYTNEFLDLTARLKPGVSLDQGARDMAAFASQLKTEYPNQFSADWGLKVKSLMEVRTGSIRPALFVLLGAVGFVLLIACANVANLFLARAAARHKEVAIRTALGANRWTLVRQLLVESTMLSVIGGAAYASVRALVALNPGNIPRVNELAIDGRVVLYTAAVSILTGVLFGLVPALQTSRDNLHVTLKEGGRTGTSDRSGQVVRRALVVAEVALALTLVTGGALLIKSFTRLSGVDPGFNSKDVLTFSLALPQSKYPNDTLQRAFFTEVIPRIGQVPGVTAAGGTSNVPFGGNWSTGSFQVEGYVIPPNANSPWGDIRVVSPGFFKALQVPVIEGRPFDERDARTAPRVAIVDQELIHKFYKPGEDAIGKRLWFGPRAANDSTQYITIVGVVGHTKHEGLDADARAQFYLPVTQGRFPVNNLDIVVRSAGDPMRQVTAIRNAIHEVDRDMPMARIRTMEEMIEGSMGQRRLSTVLLGAFAGIALLLASIGIYGVMSYTVAQRTRKLGVRVALGASRENVLGLVLRQGMSLAILGLAIGVAGAFGLTRFLSTQLYNVRATDPATFATVTGVLAVVALGATLVPALRATRVDPNIALREE